MACDSMMSIVAMKIAIILTFTISIILFQITIILTLTISRYTQLLPQLEQIDQIYDSVVKLEQAAYKLDHYAKRLEAKFKQLEKQ